LFLNVNLKIRLRYLGEGDSHASARAVFEENVLAFHALSPPAEVSLPADGPARLRTGGLAREALEVREAVEPALQPRRGDLERVGVGDEVFNVEHGADVSAHLGAVLVCDPARLVNEDAHDRRSGPARELHVYEFEPA